MPDLDPLSQIQLEERFLALSDRLTEITDDGAAAADAEADADADWRAAKAMTEVTYELKYAEVRLGLRDEEGTVPEKDAKALLECKEEYQAMHEARSGDLYRKMKVAQSADKTIYEAGRNLRTQLDTLRSLNANVRDRTVHATGIGG